MVVQKSFAQILLPNDPGASLQAGTKQYIDAADALAVPTTRQVIAGTGLTGGGALSADRTFTVSYGTSAGTALQGNDASVTNARTPTAHKSTHATGGTDALTPSDIGAEPALAPTASKTSAYTAVSGDLVLCDGSGGAFTVTLPAASAGRFVGIKKTDSSANTITVSRAGSDTIGAGAATSITLALQDETVVLMANGSNWVRKENQLTLSTLDTRFQASDSNLTTIAGLTATTDNFMVANASAWASRTPTQAKASLAITEADVSGLVTDLSAKAPLASPTFTGTTTVATLVIPPDAFTSVTGTVTPNCASGNYFRYALIGNTTVAAPTGMVDGQKITLEFIQDATGSRTVALNAIFVFGTSITSYTATTTINKRDFVGAIYNATAAKFYVVAVALGF